MSSIEKSKVEEPNYELSVKHHNYPSLNNSLSIGQEVTEQIFSGNKLIDYEEFLNSLANEYELGELSKYEDPKEVRITHHVQGSGSQWESVFQIEVDEKQSYMEWIKDSLSSIKQKLANPEQDFVNTDLYREKSHSHSYSNEDISLPELDEFIETFLEQ